MSIETMKQALEALEIEDMACRYEKYPTPEHIAKAITAIREALAEQPAQHVLEVRVWRDKNHDQHAEFRGYDKLPDGEHVFYTSPQPAQQELEELTAQRDQLADILTRTANALKGQPAELSSHSWHDLPEVAQQIKAAQQQQEPVTVLPDGSAFAVMSYPLPKDHWLYADRQYNDGEYEPVELGKPVLTHELRDAVVSAVRYAIRGATNCGKEVDFDPDALVQNAVYALCGPFTSPPNVPTARASKPWVGLTEAEHTQIAVECGCMSADWVFYGAAVERKLREKNA